MDLHFLSTPFDAAPRYIQFTADLYRPNSATSRSTFRQAINAAHINSHAVQFVPTVVLLLLLLLPTRAKTV